jgi:ribosomal protein S18 acetylase RimI-like enzyme
MNGTRFSLRLREALEAADPGRIRALVMATGFFSDEEIAVAAELAEERLARGEASGYEFLLAETGQDRRLVGYTCFGRVPLTVSTYDLYWIVVDPEQQGAGVGRRLLAESEAAIAAAGGTALYAETSGRLQYAPTRGFYRRCGYHETAVLVDFYAPGDDKVIFAKRLEAIAAAAETRAAG